MWKWVLGIVAVGLVALAAASWALWQRWTHDAIEALPGYLHEGSAAIAVSPDGNWVVTRDEHGGLRAFETATGRVSTPPVPEHPAVTNPPAAELAFTSDGILLGVPWSHSAPEGFLGLRAGTWSPVVVRDAPWEWEWVPETADSTPPDAFERIEERRRRIERANQSGSSPPADGYMSIPSVRFALPAGGLVVGRRGTGLDQRCAAWSAATGRVAWEWSTRLFGTDVEAGFPGGEDILVLQQALFLRIDPRSDAIRWTSDPFDSGLAVAERDDFDAIGAHLAFQCGDDGKGVPSRGIPRIHTLGIDRGTSHVVVTRSDLPATLAPTAPSGKPFKLSDLRTEREVAALDASTGDVVWRRAFRGALISDAFVGPAGTVLFVEDGVGRLLDAADGSDVTPAGWLRGRAWIRAAAPDPDDRALWVVLRDGRVRRLEVPPVAR